MPISSNSTITNQFVPNFKIQDLVNGQILVYNSTQGAFINTNELGSTIVISGDNLGPDSVNITHLDTSNDPVSGYVLGVDINGDLTYLSLIGGGTGALSGLTDTAITTPATNEYLKYNGSIWVNSLIALDDLANINITGAANQDILFFNGTNWVNQQLDYSDLTGTPTIPSNSSFTLVGLSDTNNTPVANAYLKWDGTASTVVYDSFVDVSEISGLATVATTGDYADLSNTPNFALYALNSSLSPVATSGLYADLTGAPLVPTVLHDLTDVTIAGAATNQFLRYNGSQWVNATVTIPTNISQMNDASISTPTTGDVLRWNGTDWADAALDWTDIANKPASFPVDAHTHVAADVTDLSTWLTSNLALITFSGISETNNVIVGNGFLRWNAGGTQINYQATIPTTDITGLATVATTGVYNDLTGKPVLATVATSGSYVDLSNKPTIPSLLSQLTDTNVNTPLADQVLSWNGTDWVNVTFDYNDLGNLPTLFDGTWGSLTGKPATFTPAVHTHVMADITDLSIPSSIDDLSDVLTSGLNAPNVGEYLKWNGTNWIPSTLNLVTSSIDDLGDVTITTPASGQYLKYNGSQWINAAIDYTLLSNVPVSFTPSAHTHVAADVTDLSTWLTSNLALITFTGISQTNNTPVNNGFLRWNAGGTQIIYQATIPTTDITGLATVATTGAYADLSGAPTIPTSLSGLSDIDFSTPPVNNEYLKYNGTDWVPFQIQYAHIAGTPTSNSYTLTGLSDTNNTAVADGYLKWNAGATSVEYVATIPVAAITGLATVATSGAYADLSGAPAIPTNNSFTFVGLSDSNDTPVSNGFLRWNAGATQINYTATIPVGVVTGLASVATSGAYGDLSGTPNLGVYALSSSLATVATTGAYADLSGTPNLAVYATIASLDNVAFSGAYADLSGTPNLGLYALSSSLATVATTGAYADLSGAPVIPVNSDFTIVGLSGTANTPIANGILRWNGLANSVEYVTTIAYTDVTGLSTVASTGDYNDLSNKPTSASYSFIGLNDTNNSAVADGFVKWNGTATELVYSATISSAVITGLAPVATSGDYTDLSNLPTLFDGTWASLTGKPATFTPATHTHVVADITDFPTIPTLLEHLTDVQDGLTPTDGQVLKWDSGLNLWVAGTYDNFEELGNVDPTPLSNGYLRWNTSANTIVYEANISALNITGLASVATSGNLHDLINIDVTTLADGYILVYDSVTETWISQSSSDVDLNTYSLDDLGDVVISTPTAGDYLRYNGTDWVDSTIPYSDITGTPTNASYTFVGLSDTNNTPIANGFLKWNSAGTSIQYQTTIPYTVITGLATVASTGSYNDLTNLPTLVTALNGLSDVTTGSLVDGYVLTYDSSDSQWKAEAPASLSINLDDIDNVVCPSPNIGETIVWNGSAWVNSDITYSDITGAPTLATVATTGDYNDLLNQPTHTILTLADTYNAAIANGFLRWNSTADEVVYDVIDVLDIQNLQTVAITGDWNDLSIKPTSNDFTFTGLQQTNDTPVPNGYLRWNGAGTQINYSATLSVDALTEVTNLASVATTGTLDSLDDVDTTGVLDGYVLVYDSGTSEWLATAASNGAAWQVVSTNQSASNGSAYMVDTTAGTVTITLPAVPSNNDYVRITDYAGTFQNYRCIVSASHDINGFARSLNLTRKNTSIELTFRTTEGWKITSLAGEETTWKTITSNTVAVTPLSEYMVNTTSGIVEVTLPENPEIGDRVKVCDLAGTFPVNKCVIKRAPIGLENIMGVAEDLNITSENATIELTYVGGSTEWKITEGIGELAVTANDIYVDLDIYVETTGSDVTGTGTQTDPYATLGYALSVLDSSFIASDATVTIHVGSGLYTSATQLTISHTYGNRIVIEGDAPVTSTNITSVNGTPTLTSFSINVTSTTNIVAGDYVKITGTTGTGDHELIRGIYEVISIPSSGVIEINPNYQGLLATLTAITLSGGTVQKQETILEFTGCHGIVVTNKDLRSLNDIVIVGDNTASKHGIITGHAYGVATSDNAGGTIDFGDNVNIYLFGGNAVHASHGGYINADYVTCTRNANGIYSGYNSVVSAKYALLTNTVDKGAIAEYGGLVDAEAASVHGCGEQVLYANNKGIIKADTATIDDMNNLSGATAMVHARGMSAIFIADYSGSSVTYSPTWNTTGNGNSYIGAA